MPGRIRGYSPVTDIWLFFLMVHGQSWQALATTYLVSSFDLDMTLGVLTLQFKVNVMSKTLNASTLVLQDRPDVTTTGWGTYHRLTGAYDQGAYNSSVIEIFLTNDDYYAIQLNRQLALSTANTYITIDAGLLRATDGSGVTPIVNGNALRVGGYISDQLPPFPLGFTLDMQTGLMSVTFSEPVDVGTFDATAITLQEKRDKIYDAAWQPWLGKDWSRYTLVDEGINVTSVTHYHFGHALNFGMNDTYPYDYLDMPADFPRNFTVTWDGHTYTYRTDSNATYWVGGDEIQAYGFAVHFSLGEDNLNAIKAHAPLATSPNTVYLAVYKPIVKDIAGNNMSTAVAQDYLAIPINPGGYTYDTSSPSLLFFNMDLNRGIVTLQFSETVAVDKLNVTDLCIQKASNWTSPYSKSNGEGYCLHQGVTTSTSKTPVISLPLQLGPADLNGLKLLQAKGLCISKYTSYLSFPSSLITDTAYGENPVNAISRSSAMRATAYVSDSSSPVLLSFSLDWDARVLALTFNEAIDAETVIMEDITLQVSANPGKYGKMYSLSSASIVVSASGAVLSIHIGFDDYAAFKLIPGLLISQDTTYLTFPRGTFSDVARPVANGVQAIQPSKGLQASLYIPDQSPPFLRGFAFDMDAGLLTLIFSEPIAIASFDLTKGINITSTTSSYTLVDSSLDTEAVDGMEPLVRLSEGDLRSLKANEGLCRGYDDCSIVLADGVAWDINFVQDSNPNLLQETPVLVTTYWADVTPPLIVEYKMNMNAGRLDLIFSEPVRASTVDCSKLVFHSSSTSWSSDENVTVSASCINNNLNGDRLTIVLWPNDVAIIKSKTFLARDKNHVWLSLVSGFVRDMFGNLMSGISSRSDFLRPVTFIPDLEGPQLLSFDLNKNQQLLRLRFDEPVNTSTFLVDGITLLGYKTRINLPTYTLTSSGSSVSSSASDRSIVSITLASSGDLAAINSRAPRLATAQRNTYLIMSRFVVQDLSPEANKNIAIAEGFALQLGPTLRFFYLDMDLGQLTLVFSRDVNPDSFQILGVTLVNADASVTYTLTGDGDGGALSTLHGNTTLVLTMTDFDLNALKSVSGLCNSQETTYLSFLPETVQDNEVSASCCGPNGVVEVPLESPQNTVWFVPDTRDPQLERWTLDLTQGYLQMFFDEPVNAGNLNLSMVQVIQQNTSMTVTLSPNSTILTGNGTVQTIKLQSGGGRDQELDLIKSMISKAPLVFDENVALAIADGGVKDMSLAGNPISGLSVAHALRVAELYPDEAQPYLLYYDLDLDSKMLTLVFNEVVNTNSFDVTRLAFHAAEVSIMEYFHSLTNSSLITTNDYSAVIEIIVSDADISEIKMAYPLASSTDFTYLTAKNGLCNDLSLNEFKPTGAMKVNILTQDSTRPNVQKFDLDMDTGTLLIYLDDAVWPDLVDLTGVTLQYANFTGIKPKWLYSLTHNSKVSTTQIDSTLVINIGKDDLDNIKMKDQIGLSKRTTYLTVDMKAFQDLAGNPVNDVHDGYGIQVSQLVLDVTPPELLGFSLYHDARMVVYFSEPVKLASIDVTTIQMQNHFGNASTNLTRRSRVETTNDNVIIQIDLSGDWSLNPSLGWGTTNADIADMNRIGIGLQQLQTYLIASARTCKDVSGNALKVIPNAEKREMGPIISKYILDMSTGTLNLTINLPVFGGSFVDPTAITLQWSHVDNTYQATLTSCSSSRSGNTTEISINICHSDMALIKGQAHLALGRNSTYLSLSSNPGLTYSISTRPIDFYVKVTGIPSQRALQTSFFIPDTTPPYLVSFNIDMSLKKVDFFFSEPIILATFNMGKVTLYGSATLEPYCILTTPVAVTAHSASVISVYFNDEDSACLDVYKTGRLLTILPAAGEDYAGNRIIEITPVDPMYASVFIHDSVSPNVTGAILDLAKAKLYLNFSENVDPLTQDSSKLSLAYTAQSGVKTFINFTSAVPTFSDAHAFIALDLNFAFTEFQDIKLDVATQYALTGLSSSGYIVSNLTVEARTGMIKDFAANDLQYQSLGVSSVIGDTQLPTLLSFDLQLSSSTLVLYFDEPVAASTLVPSQIKILASPSSSASSVSLSTSSVVIPATNDRSVSVTLSLADKLALQLSSFATSQSDTYLSIAAGAIYDIAPQPNPNLEIADSSALQVGPAVARAVLNVNEEYMLLVFSKPIDFTTFDPTALIFAGNKTGAESTLQVFNSTAYNMKPISNLTLYTRVDFSSSFINALKAKPGLVITANTSCLAYNATLASDSLSNNVVACSIANAQHFYFFQPDVNHPAITHIDLDMNHGILNITFHEPTATALTNLQLVTIQNTYMFRTNTTKSVPFTSGESVILTSTPCSPVQVIQVGETEMADMKMDANMAKTRFDSYLTAFRHSFFDCAVPPNTAWSLLRSYAYQIDRIIPDTTSPKLLYFALDYNQGQLALTFNEPVAAQTFNISGLMIMEYAYSRYGSFYRFTNYSSIWREELGRTLLVNLSQEDWFAINAQPRLAHIPDQTFLIMDNVTIQDTSGNYVRRIRDGEAMLVYAYVPDTTNPRLLNYTIDMDTGLVHLMFSEMILASSFNAAGLVFESLDRSCFYYQTQGKIVSSCTASEWAAYQSITLTPTKTLYVGPDSTDLIFVLSDYDMNAIKNEPLLLKSPTSAYLNILPKACADMSGNPVAQIGGLLPFYDPAVVSRGMKAGLYLPDTTRGWLRSFNLDMQQSILSLNFTEPMLVESANVQAINLHSNPVTSYGRSYQLTSSTFMQRKPIGMSNIFQVGLTQTDLDQLKILGIGRQDVVRARGFGIDDSVWITIAANAFYDIFNLPFLPVFDADIWNATPLKVDTLVPDQTGPKLTRFILDQATRYLHLHFNEAVDKSTLVISEITLLAFVSLQIKRMVLTTVSQIVSLNPAEIILDLASNAMNQSMSDWETLVSLGWAPETELFLGVSEGAVVDIALAQNPLQAISIYYPLKQAVPTCTCPSGFYIQSNCTALANAVCRRCTICPSSTTFEIVSCNKYADTQCQTCSSCRYPYWASAPCSKSSDTVCSYCSVCGADEYVTDECNSVSDRRCGSCQVCTFLNTDVEQGCQHTSPAWREQNCCKTSTGAFVPCSERSHKEFGISTLQGKRNWVFKRTVPPVMRDMQWTGNFYDWYAKSRDHSGFA